MPEKWAGVVVENPQVQAYVREHGAPVHTKPHGSGKTILYYRDTAAEEEDVGEFKDFAGEPTPGNRSYVLQKPLMGSAEIGSTVISRTISGSRGHATASAPSGNPNRIAEEANILNEDKLDEEVTNIEKEEREKRLEREREAGLVAVDERVGKVSQELTGELPDVKLPHEEKREEQAQKKNANAEDRPYAE